jgi:hypothetical protein
MKIYTDKINNTLTLTNKLTIPNKTTVLNQQGTNGSIIYNTTDQNLYYKNNLNWTPISSGTVINLDNYRPYFTPNNVLSPIWINNLSGDDTNGDGTQINPYKTIKRAIRDIGMTQSSNFDVNLEYTGQPYTIDFIMLSFNYIDIKGIPFEVETVTITSVVSTTSDERRSFGQEITIDRTPALLDDEWLGRHLWLKGQNSNNYNFIVYRNVGNTLYGILTDRRPNTPQDQQPSILVNRTLTLLDYPELNIIGNGFLSSIQGDFFYCKITGNTVFFQSSGKVEYAYCMIANTANVAARGAGIYFLGSSIFSPGTSNNGFYNANNGGEIRFSFGTVYTGHLLDGTLAPNRFASVVGNGYLTFFGGSVFRQLDSKGITATGSTITQLLTTYTNGLKVYFEDRNPSELCEAAFKINTPLSLTTFAGNLAKSGSYVIPCCSGSINNDYFVSAISDAYVELFENSPQYITLVNTNTVSNSVSADNGNTLSSRSGDGTVIKNGNPPLSQLWSNVLNVNTSPYNVNIETDSKLFIDTTGGSIIVNLPLDTVLVQNGSELWFIKIGGNTITIQATAPITINNTTSINVNNTMHITFYNNNWYILSSM